MKVLFVSSGNSKKFAISPFIKAQGEDLINNGIEVDFFSIKGKGVIGYLGNIKRLRKQIKNGSYDLIHAHYVLSAWVALLSLTGHKIIVSFMGGDTYGDVDINGKRKASSYFNIILAKLIQPFVSQIIVKSKNLEEYVYMKKKCSVLPNGINLDVFYPKNREQERKNLGLALDKKYVLFLGNKNDPRKNYQLIHDLVENNVCNFDLLSPYPIPKEQVVAYLNAVDLLVFPSFLEGSPNLVKEAMACNLPVVSVDVGDTTWLLSNVSSSHIANRDPIDFMKKINLSLKDNTRSNGREQISLLGLESQNVIDRLIEIYKKGLKD